MEYWLGSAKSPEESVEKAFELGQKSLALDDSHAQTHDLLSHLYSIRREHDRALAEAERAAALDPGGADVHAWLATSLLYAGRHEEAIPFFEKAIRLNPFAPTWYFFAFGSAYQLMERYEDAVTQYKKALHVAPDNVFAHLSLALTYSLSGRDEEARAEADEVLRIDPQFSLERVARTWEFAAHPDRAIELLRKAGLK